MRNLAASIIGNGVISLLCQLRCQCNPDHDKFPSLSNTTVVAICSKCVFVANLAGIDFEKLYRAAFICQYGLFCCMALVSFRLFCKNLGNLQEFFWQMDYRPPWQKIARPPMSPPQGPHVSLNFRKPEKLISALMYLSRPILVILNAKHCSQYVPGYVKPYSH